MYTQNKAVIFFHKNIKNIYKQQWINQCVESILEQKNVLFDILEVNYGNEDYSVLNEYKNRIIGKHMFYKSDFKNHSEAMVFLLNKAFDEFNYSIVFNTNLDDFYSLDRFEKQIDCINSGYLMCSSLCEHIDSDNNIIRKYTPSDLNCNIDPSNENYLLFEDIYRKLKRGGNIINHSGVCFSKEFWNSYDIEKNLLRYRDDIPYEDFTLWRRAIFANIKIGIVNSILISYRIHSTQITMVNSSLPNSNKLEPNNDKRRIGICFICKKKYINKLEEHLKKINDYFLIKLPKTYFIITDDIELLKQKISVYDYSIYTKNINLNKKSNNIFKYFYEFYPFIEIKCDILYWIPIDTLINKKYKEKIYNNDNNPYIRYLDYSIDIFGGLTHYFLKFCLSNKTIDEFQNDNLNLFKIINIKTKNLKNKLEEPNLFLDYDYLLNNYKKKSDKKIFKKILKLF